MKVSGRVFSGVMRGDQLIKKYYPRLVGMLRFEPFKGTLDIRLEKPLRDITQFAAKTIEHVLLDGSVHRDAILAPVTLTITKNDKKSEIGCWVIQFEKAIYKFDVLEILADTNLRKAYQLDDGDYVEITFTKSQKLKKETPFKKLKQFYKKETQLMK